jgi:hypothetical protein
MLAWMLLIVGSPAAAEPKPSIRGLVSMGAYKFVVNASDPVNTLEYLGNPKGDHEFTEQFMHACREAFGRRCIFDNHDLDTTPAKAVLPIYDAMNRLGGPIEFQTGPATPKDYEGTIKYGVSLGAGSIELWQDFGGFPHVPDEQLKRWAAMVEANTRR